MCSIYYEQKASVKKPLVDCVYFTVSHLLWMCYLYIWLEVSYRDLTEDMLRDMIQIFPTRSFRLMPTNARFWGIILIRSFQEIPDRRRRCKNNDRTLSGNKFLCDFGVCWTALNHTRKGKNWSARFSKIWL